MRMIDRTIRFLAGAVLAAFVVAGVGMSASYAQQPSPAQLLQQNPNGGTPLVNAIEQRVLANHATFQAFLGLVPSANDQQKTAIATALIQSAKDVAPSDQALAVEWQRLAAAITDPVFKTAALNALGDVQLGAVGGAAGGDAGAGLGGASGPTGSSGGTQNIGSNGTSTGAGNLAGGGSGAASGTSAVVTSGTSTTSGLTCTTTTTAGCVSTAGKSGNCPNGQPFQGSTTTTSC